MDILDLAGPVTPSLDTFLTGTVVTTAIDKATLTSGEEVVRFRNDATVHRRSPDSTYTITTYTCYREDGDWILGYSALDDTTADTVMVTGPSVGKTWHQGTATAEVIGQDDVSVPAGTYRDAWVVRVTSDQGIEMYSWYAKGTGLVRLHYAWAYQGYGQDYRQELTSATIK